MKTKPQAVGVLPSAQKYDPRPEQSVALLKALHILTVDGRMNQDSRRKLKQVYHLYNFIEPLLKQVHTSHPDVTLVDHGAGKSYLGFILYDLFFKQHAKQGQVIGVESRADLVARSQTLAAQFGFDGMRFIASDVRAVGAFDVPPRIDIVTALHACDTATDDAIAFGLAHKAQHLVLVPCCQAELAAKLRETQKEKRPLAETNPLAELYRRPIHTREFGSQLTNVLRCLQLEAHGYEVTVTELVGWEHSMKNELILATKSPHKSPHNAPHIHSAQRAERANKLTAILSTLGLASLAPRYLD